MRVTDGDGGSHRVTIAGKTAKLRFAGPLREVAVSGEIDGRPFPAQIERIGLHYRIIHNGLQVDARGRRAPPSWIALMPFKAPPDLKVPALADAGPAGRRGGAAGPEGAGRRKLAVIEAMKMENILVAQQDGVVAKVAASKGESLSVDQVILEFQ